MPLVPLALDRDPAAVLASVATEPGAMLLDVPDPERPVTLVSCRPDTELVVPDGPAVDPLDAIARFVAGTPVDASQPFPLAGGAVVMLAYELGWHAIGEPGPARAPHPAGTPLAVARRYDPMLVFDAGRRTWSLLVLDPARANAPWLARLADRVAPWAGPLAATPLVPALGRAAHLAAIRRVQAYLAAGDCYQVNLTQRFTAALDAPAVVLFDRLARRHHAPYRGYLDLGPVQIVMNSPELFLRRRGRRLETRPIKGTRPRGRDRAADAALVAELAWDAKEAAEHVMIVDLERNDLGRVAEVGSVVVEMLGGIETHPSLHHMVSVVAARTRAGVGLAELLRATFPGGSITGAPKLRVMEIIAALEPEPRGVYTGAIGLVDPRGDLELALPIRTAVVAAGRLHWHAGGGIVIGADPAREWDEVCLKTAALRSALAAGPAAEVAWTSG